MKIFLCGRSIHTKNERFPKYFNRLSLLALTILISLNSFSKTPVEKTVTINLKNVTLIHVVSQIEKQTNFLFVFDEHVVDMKKIVTVFVKKVVASF